jgi:hypothetical protein
MFGIPQIVPPAAKVLEKPVSVPFMLFAIAAKLAAVARKIHRLTGQFPING